MINYKRVESLTRLTLCFTLASCALVQQDIPQNMPSAKIRFVDRTGGGVENRFISSFSNESCDDRKFIASLSGIAINSNRKSLSMPLGDAISSSAKTEISVSPGAFTYSVGVSIGGNYLNGVQLLEKKCGTSNTFNASADSYYEVTFEVEENRCISKVYKLTVDEKGSYYRAPETSTHKTEKNCKVGGAELM